MKHHREWPKTATFRRRRYAIQGVTNLGTCPVTGGRFVGDADAPTARGKKLRICLGMSPRETAHYSIHEALHVCLWDLDEDTVDEIAGDLTRLLVGLGLVPEE